MNGSTLEVLSPLFYGLAAGGLVALFLIFFRTRKTKVKELELAPNCLLTKFPVMLITGARSLKNGQVEHRNSYEMLRQHGYQTEWVQIPIEFESQKNIEKQLLEVLKELHQEGHRFHFMVAAEIFDIFRLVLSQNPEFLDSEQPVVGSLSLLNYPESKSILKRAVELSEQDYLESQKANSHS